MRLLRLLLNGVDRHRLTGRVVVMVVVVAVVALVIVALVPLAGVTLGAVNRLHVFPQR